MDLKENCIVIITMIKKTNLDIKEVSNLLDIDTTTLKRSALADFNNIDIESLNKILKKKNYLYDFAKSHSEDLIPKISKDSPLWSAALFIVTSRIPIFLSLCSNWSSVSMVKKK